MRALAKLTDQKELVNIATSLQNGSACVEAAKKLNNQTLAQEVFMDFAKSKKDGLIRIEAAKHLADHALAQEVFADIARKDRSYGARVAAADNLSDRLLAKEVYAEVAEIDCYYEHYKGVYNYETVCIAGYPHSFQLQDGEYMCIRCHATKIETRTKL